MVMGWSLPDDLTRQASSLWQGGEEYNAARGLDFQQVTRTIPGNLRFAGDLRERMLRGQVGAVVNFELPSDVPAYTHRIGAQNHTLPPRERAGGAKPVKDSI